jgi:hydrogenase maturation protease
LAPKILIACVGNIFLGDDGFGVEVARRLAGRTLPEGTQVKDFGIRSYDLAYALMEDWDDVILVDALPRGGAPGTIYILKPEPPAAGMRVGGTIDAHTMNPDAVLQMVSMLGGQVKHMVVVGCEPSPGDPEEGGMELSAPVNAAVDEAIRAIEDLLAGLPTILAGSTVRD